MVRAGLTISPEARTNRNESENRVNYIRNTEIFMESLEHLQDPSDPEYSARIAAATTPVGELPMPGLDYARVDYYVAEDGRSGYGLVQVFDDGPTELIGVFSDVKGRGDEIVEDAIFHGANTLDCFDGYLPGFYERHGFTEVNRVPNWTPGEPDVVFMERGANA